MGSSKPSFTSYKWMERPICISLYKFSPRQLIPCQIRFCFVLFLMISEMEGKECDQNQKKTFFSAKVSRIIIIIIWYSSLLNTAKVIFYENSIISKIPHRDKKILPNHILMDKMKVILKDINYISLKCAWVQKLTIAMLEWKHMGIS